MDKQMADRIIVEYFRKIYGFAVKKSFSYDEAEELCAEIIEEVYLSLLKAEEVVNTDGFIWRISEHKYARYVSRKKKLEGISIDGLQIPFYEDFPPEDSDGTADRLRREIAFLTEKRRRIVYLFYYENRSVSSIAQGMNLPVGTVKWHLNKARNELKEGFSMERNIGNLGIHPVKALGMGHDGNPGNKNQDTSFYLGDSLSLNIVYSVYDSPKTKEEIARELGMTPVFLEDKINFLEGNGFLVKTAKNRYTTFVSFSPRKYSLELQEKKLKKQLEIAQTLAELYVPAVREALAGVTEVYIPGGNRELLESAAIFYAVNNCCRISCQKDISRYFIKTTSGGNFIAYVDLEAEVSDPDYQPTLNLPDYWACGNMDRDSLKYPVSSWSIDSRYCSRKGRWENNLYTDYEYLYEFIKGEICENEANSEKFKRLREREFLTDDNKVNIMIVKGDGSDFFRKLPALDEKIKERYADIALEYAMMYAKSYPPQMQDLAISNGVGGFICRDVGLMVKDILYANGTFRPLTENEKVTSDLIMFSDILPQ